MPSHSMPLDISQLDHPTGRHHLFSVRGKSVAFVLKSFPGDDLRRCDQI